MTPTPPTTPTVEAVPATGYPDADTVAAAVLGCVGVVRLSGGTFGEVATYLPGRRVTGVRYTPHGLEVHVVVTYGEPLPVIADRIRDLLGLLVVGLPIDVVIDDLDLA